MTVLATAVEVCTAEYVRVVAASFCQCGRVGVGKRTSASHGSSDQESDGRFDEHCCER